MDITNIDESLNLHEAHSGNEALLENASGKENELGTFPIGERRRLSGGSNHVEWVQLVGDGSGVFKPSVGERYLSEFDEREFRGAEKSLYKRERAAYLVDQALGLNLVPVTVVRSINELVGSMQEFVPNASGLWEFPENLGDQLYAMGIFDYLIWNKDRGDSNSLVTQVLSKSEDYFDYNLHLIDNGLSFDPWDTAYGGPYFMKGNLNRYVYGKQVPPKIKTAFQQLSVNLTKRDELRKQLGELLPKRAVDAFSARLSFLAGLLTEKESITPEEMVGRDNKLTYHPN